MCQDFFILLKKIAIIVVALFASVFLIELTLTLNNPFVNHTVLEDIENFKPTLFASAEPDDFVSMKSVFVLNNREQAAENTHNWLAYIAQENPHHNLLNFFDISSNARFLNKSKPIQSLVIKHTPTVLILHLEPSYLNDVIDIPHFNYQNEQKSIPILSNQPEIARTLKSIANKTSDDTTIIYSFNNIPGFQQSPPPLPEKLKSKLQKELASFVQEIKDVQHVCKANGVQLIIIPYPILWHENKQDNYTQIPLNKILFHDQTPSSWFAILYYQMLNTIQKSIPKQIRWIDLYKNFPHDSRFYLDGFRLNEQGHEMFAQMFLGRMEFMPLYKELF